MAKRLPSRITAMTPGLARSMKCGITPLLPSLRSVIETGTRKLVFVLGPQDSLEPREVELGDREGGQLEVKSGLREGEQVARGASFLLDSESRLQSALTGLGTPPPAAAREAQ